MPSSVLRPPSSVLLLFSCLVLLPALTQAQQTPSAFDSGLDPIGSLSRTLTPQSTFQLDPAAGAAAEEIAEFSLRPSRWDIHGAMSVGISWEQQQQQSTSTQTTNQTAPTNNPASSSQTNNPTTAPVQTINQTSSNLTTNQTVQPQTTNQTSAGQRGNQPAPANSNSSEGSTTSISVAATIRATYTGAHLSLDLGYSGSFPLAIQGPSTNQARHHTFNSGLTWAAAETQFALIGSTSVSEGFSPDAAPSSSLGQINEEFTAIRALTGKTNFGLRADLDITLPEAPYGLTVDVSGGFVLDSSITAKSRLGVGMAFGIQQQKNGLSNPYVRPGVLFGWSGSKLSFSGSAGVEIRSLADGGTRMSPAGTLTAGWNPSASTSAGLSLYARSAASVSVADQYYVAVGGTASVQRQVLGRGAIGLDIGWQQTTYQSGTQDLPSQSDESYVYARARLTIRLRDRVSYSLYYQLSDRSYSSNQTDTPGWAQAGMAFTYAF